MRRSSEVRPSLCSGPALRLAVAVTVLMGLVAAVPATAASDPVSVTGRLRVLSGEPGAPTQYFVEAATTAVAVADVPADIPPNSRITVSGAWRDAPDGRELVATDVAVRRRAADRPSVIRGLGDEPVWHDVHVAGMNLTGTSTHEVTRETVAGIVAEVDDYYSRSTGGRHRFRLAEWVPFGDEMPDVSTCDDFLAQMTALDGLVTTDDPKDLVVGLTDTACTGLAGRAFIGAPGVLMFDYLHSDGWAHELGHNLGLGHSGQADCAGDVLSECPDLGATPGYDAYGGDDVMGYSTQVAATEHPTLNPNQRDFLGAWPAAAEQSWDSPPAEPRTLTLATVDADSGIRALRLSGGTTVLRVVGRAAPGGMRIGVYEKVAKNRASIRRLPEPLGVGTYGGSLGYRLRVVDVTDTSATLRLGNAAHLWPPQAPGGVTAVPLDGSARVSWQAVPDALSYEVAAVGGTATCGTGGSSTSCTVLGLTNGVARSFRVTVTTADGVSDPSAPSVPVTPRCATSVSLTEDLRRRLSVTVTPPAVRPVRIQRRDGNLWVTVQSTRTGPDGRAPGITRALGTLRALAPATGTCAAGASVARAISALPLPLLPQHVGAIPARTPLFRHYRTTRAWSRDARTALPARTDARRSITYRALGRRCAIVTTPSGPRVKGLRLGPCQVRATAAGGSGRAALDSLVTLRIVRR